MRLGSLRCMDFAGHKYAHDWSWTIPIILSIKSSRFDGNAGGRGLASAHVPAAPQVYALNPMKLGPLGTANTHLARALLSRLRTGGNDGTGQGDR